MADERVTGYKVRRSGRSVIIEEVSDPQENTRKAQEARVWWQTEAEVPFFAKAQAWQGDVGSKMAASSGINVQRESHEMDENEQEIDLGDVLAKGMALHIEHKLLMGEAKRAMRRKIALGEASP